MHGFVRKRSSHKVAVYYCACANSCMHIISHLFMHMFGTTVVQAKVGKGIILKIKTKILRKLFFQKKVFLHGEKEKFEEYSLFWNLPN